MNDDKPTGKGLLAPVFKAAAFTIALLLVMLIGGYLNESWKVEWLTGLIDFLAVYLAIIAGYVFMISIWDYLYPFYKDKKLTKYVKPLITSIGLAFGLWLVLEFVARLAYFVPDDGTAAFLTTGLEVFFKFFALIFILILFVNYGNALRTDAL